MKVSRGVRFYGIALIAFGVFNLLGAGNFRQFALMFKGLNNVVIIALYAFTVLYGICGVYCGTKILRLEDWARKVIVTLASISVVLGFLLNRIVIRNLKEFLLSEQSQISLDLIEAAFMHTMVFMILVTIFEISIIFFFTRSKVIRQFKSK
ncbi:MAG: hypothetical protein WBB66_03845 [Candidatus Omnitrophota bacterium]